MLSPRKEVQCNKGREKVERAKVLENSRQTIQSGFHLIVLQSIVGITNVVRHFFLDFTSLLDWMLELRLSLWQRDRNAKSRWLIVNKGFKDLKSSIFQMDNLCHEKKRQAR